jgi:hypothetical protein
MHRSPERTGLGMRVISLDFGVKIRQVRRYREIEGQADRVACQEDQDQRPDVILFISPR